MSKHLSLRLGLYFVAVAVSSILLAALASNYFVNRKFDEYVVANEEARNGQIAQALGQAYSAAGGWTPELVSRMPHWAAMMGLRIRIAARDGTQIIDTAGGPGSTADAADRPEGLVSEVPIVTPKHRFVGIVYFSRLRPDDEFLSQDVLFRRSTNTSLIVAGLIAAALALISSVFVSQRLVRPIRALTSATQAMQTGNLAQRVQTAGDDEIGELGRAFNRMADTLAHQEELRKNLTADVAHELRTPLATIQSQIEALQDGVMEPTPERLESIHEETVRLTRLVGDLRQLSEAEGGKLPLRKEPIDLNELLAEMASGLEPRFAEESVALNTQPAAEPQTALVDRDKMRQVLVNLTSNALKFTPAGGWVRVRTSTDGDWRLMTVVDNGAGIAEDDLPYIFERFFRADRSRSRATGGAGIGLAITKQLVEAHGGRITVASAPDQGTTFEVRLPAARTS